MLGKIIGILCTVGLIYSIITGNISAVSEAALTSSGKAVELTVSLVGMMGLWGGIMRVAEKSGVSERAAVFLMPLIRLVFPDAAKKRNGHTEIAAAMTANLLGMGNAATPLALRAMSKLKENSGDSDRASSDMIVFAVMSCSPFTLMPATVITLRQAAGSSDAAGILIPVWIVSLVSNIMAIVLARVISGRK